MSFSYKPNTSAYRNQKIKLGTVLFLLSSVAGCSSEDSSKIFEDVSLASGLDDYVGMTHGAAWGDFDNDGLPDLYTSNHLNQAKLFRNLGNGRFNEVSNKVFKPKDLGGDKHGAVWADFNNDNLLDLVQLTGAAYGIGAEPKLLFINHGDKFAEVAESLGVANKFGRTRMPLWFDLDGNGRLDLFQGAEARFDNLVPPFSFLQQDDSMFIEDQDAIQFKGKSVPFCIITELNNDSHSELVCRVVGDHRTAQIFDTSTSPAKNIDLLPVTAFEDIAAGDFDNDGAIDLFLARKSSSNQIAFGRPSSNMIIADMRFEASNIAKKTGFEFQSAGRVTFHIKPTLPINLLTPNQIHIGHDNLQPKTLTFSLSKETAKVMGTVPYEAGKNSGVYIGFTPPNKWQVYASGAPIQASKGRHKYQQLTFNISTTEPITDLTTLEGTKKTVVTATPSPARLFMNREGKLIEESDKRGVNDRLISATNVVTGDFNNDMYLDLFVIASDDLGKQENLLLLNKGNGYFSVVSDAGGAAGNKIGVGDSVTTVDFDRDGFLDLLTATGGSMGRSLGLPSDNGAYHLYHNISNDNHWLEIDLEGTLSNKNGIGAIVRITTDNITQTRVQDNGVHHRSQNHQRLHFGLAKHTLIDKISVQWPSGQTQDLAKVKADQILLLKEPAS